MPKRVLALILISFAAMASNACADSSSSPDSGGTPGAESEPMMGDDPECTHERYEYTCDQNADRLPPDSNGWTGNEEIDNENMEEEFERRGIKP